MLRDPGRLRRQLTTVMGQGISSASNLVLQVLLASQLPARDFGVLVAATSLYYLGLALVRAAVGDVLNAVPGADWYRARRLALGIGVWAGAAVALGAAIAPVQQDALLLLAAAMPMLMFNDALRYRAWSSGRPSVVVWMDGSWFLVIAVTALSTIWWEHSGSSLMCAWIVGGLWGTVIGIARRPHATDDAATDEGAEHRARWGFIADQLPQAVTANLLPVLLVLGVGATVGAAYRVSLVPYMLAETVLLAVRVEMLPMLRNAGEKSMVAARRDLARATRVTVGVAGVCSAAGLLLLFDPVRALLGEAGDEVGVWFAVPAAAVIARASGRPSADFVALVRGRQGTGTVRTVSASTELVLAIASGAVAGLPGVLVARTAVLLVTAVVWRRLADALVVGRASSG